MKRTPRGFAIYGEYKDSRGNRIRVQESSDASGAHCWIFTHDAEGRSAYIHNAEMHSAAPHLTKAQARRVAAALLRFANG